MVSDITTVAISLQGREEFKRIATSKKKFMKGMLESWVAAGCPMPDEMPCEVVKP